MGIGRRIFALFVILMLAMLTELATIFGTLKEARIVHNLMQVYSDTIDLWNIAFLVTQAIDSSILWGNSNLIMQKPSIVTARDYFYILQKKTIPSLQSQAANDLGNFTDLYKHIISGDFDFCNNLLTTYPIECSRCGQGEAYMWSSNLNNVFMKVTSILDQTILNLERSIDNKTERYAILHESNYKAYRAYNARSNRSLSEMYYTIMLPLSANLETIINPDNSLKTNTNKDSIFYAKLYGSIAVISAIIVYIIFVNRTLHLLNVASAMLPLIPLRLLMTNKPLVLRLTKRIPKDN